MWKKIFTLGIGLIIITFLLTGYNYGPENVNAKTYKTSKTTYKTPKYVFLFIGDGMSYSQINSAQVYKGTNEKGNVNTKDLNFTKFPITGVSTTQDSTSFCPDSASTATAIACGVKTHSGVIGLKEDKKTSVKNISELMKNSGKKVGIISSVTLNHATPAAFYSHVSSRGEYYDIALQMANSNIDYFGGGSLNNPKGKDNKQQDVYNILKNKGYKVANTKSDILSLDKSSGKTYAVSPILQDSGAMPYSIDTKSDDLKLKDFVKKGIDVIDNENGFFMMCESGKIDWACHANDAMSSIKDVLGFEDAIQVAVDFYNKHPEETLILVTGDHETGGMSIGYASTGYDTAFNILEKQKMSYVEFDSLISNMKKSNSNIKLEDVMSIITEKFGLIFPNDPLAKKEENKSFVLSQYEFEKIKKGFEESIKEKDKRSKNQESYLLYGDYDPLSVSLTHVINNKAGIGWTSYAHTGTPVPVYAIGAGAEAFNGSYHNVEINKKLLEICKFK